MTNGTNPFDEEDDEPVIYPKHKDPFAKRTKSVKQMRKDEKKNMKKKKKLEKKEEKTRKKQEKFQNGKNVMIAKNTSPNNNKHDTGTENAHHDTESETKQSPSKLRLEIPANGSSTLPMPTSPSGLPIAPVLGFQTLDVRSLADDRKKSPILPNKRILELKGSGSPTLPVTPPSTDNGQRKQTFVPSLNGSDASSEPVKSVDNAVRPKTLNLTASANSTVHHDKNRMTSPLASKGHTDDDITRVRRSSSVSKLNKQKKKRNKKLKRRLGKKKKSNRDHELCVLEDKDAMNQVVMRKKQIATISNLQKEVTETEDILRNSVVNLVNQRDSMLEHMLTQTEQLEEKAYGFAQTANETKLKQRAKNTCCGIASKYRVCWYICACETGVKRKKKSGRTAADLAGDTEDDCYKRVDLTNKEITHAAEDAMKQTKTEEKKGFTGSSSSLANKLTEIPNLLRGSMPTLLKKESPGNGDKEGSFPRRKTSSVGSAVDVKKPTKRQQEKERKEKEKKEQSYRLYADEQFDDEETRKRAISLLRMDDKRV